IKFFSGGGHKLDDAVEDRIAATMAEAFARPIGAAVGRVVDAVDAGDRYRAHLAAAIGNRLDGLTVVVDCAHGAAFELAPQAYADAGAEVIA
ncbi:phosphoglucosamine mutase, partial [Streptomyces sp. SID10244]|nr:phosphoglucosamine mutase [Streptomyces sp. SID10244]